MDKKEEKLFKSFLNTISWQARTAYD